MGHEPVGEVVALGPEAKGVGIGDRRIVYPWIGCGVCKVCEDGDELFATNQSRLVQDEMGVMQVSFSSSCEIFGVL